MGKELHGKLQRDSDGRKDGLWEKEEENKVMGNAGDFSWPSVR